MKKLYCFIFLIMQAVLAPSLQAQTQPAGPVLKLVISPCLLKSEMRKLWYDHALWTRNVVLCIVDDLPGNEEAFIRLLENQEDISNALKPYVGESTGVRLTDLLKHHVSLTAEVVQAIKNKTTSQFDNASQRWYVNGEEIVTLLSANINLPKEELMTLMQEHLQLTKTAALHRMEKNYAAEIVSYDKVNNHILQLSDLISESIIKQFPEKLKPVSSN